MGEYNNNVRMTKTAVQTLNEHMKKKKITPQYECIHDGTVAGDGLFTYRLTCADYTAIGSGGSKKDARQIAAMAMLYEINEGDELLPDNKMNGNSDKENGHFDNAVGTLQMLCDRENLSRPTYELINEVGPGHAKIFIIECRVLTYKQRGTGRMKQAAKREAARKMIAALSENKKITKSSFKQMDGDISNVDGSDGNSTNDEVRKKVENEQVQEDEHKIEAKEIPAKDSNSAPVERPPQVLNDRVKTMVITEIPKSQKNETKRVNLPTGNLVFQRKYIARKLSAVYNKLKDPGNDKKLSFVNEIYVELETILRLLEVEIFQSFVQINNDKFMLSIYVSTDPQIMDLAVDDNEIDLKIFLYRRVIGVLLDLVNRY